MLPYINEPFLYVAAQLGCSADELKLIFSFLLSYPLAGLLKRVPDAKPQQKNLFIISVSIFYLVGLFDLWAGLQTLAISSIGAYAIAKYLRGSPYMPWIGFVFLMGHCSVNQLARQFANDPASVDITGAQMVLVMKLSAFCWNVADGLVPDEELSEFQRDRVLRELPSLLDYAGYVLFFPSLLAGPACDFAEYRRYLDTTMFAMPASLDPAKRPRTRKRHKIPRSATPATIKAVTGLVWILVFLQLSLRFPPSITLVGSDSGHPVLDFFRRVFYLYLIGFVARTKYYGVWSLTEGSCILAGIGFNGVDPATGRIAWNRMQNIDAWGVESAQNTRAYLENWNMKTNAWLRNYVYLRVTPRGKKPGFRASLATFVTSAFWHGFYPGYYMTFVLASFFQTAAKNFRRHVRPFFLEPVTQKPLPSKVVYDLVTFLFTQFFFGFATAPFVLLTFEASWLAWTRVYYFAIVGVAISMAIFASPVKPALKKALEARAAAAGVSSSAGKTEKSEKTEKTDKIVTSPAALSREIQDLDGAAAKNATRIATPESPGLPPTQVFPQPKRIVGPGLAADPQAELDMMVEELKEDFGQLHQKAAAAAAVAAAKRKKQA